MKRILILAALVGIVGCDSTPVTSRVVDSKTDDMILMYTADNMPIFIPVYTLKAKDGATADVSGTAYGESVIGQPYPAQWHSNE